MLFAYLASAVGFGVALYLYLYRPMAAAEAQGRRVRFPLIAWALEWMERDLARLRARLAIPPPAAPAPLPPTALPEPIYEGMATLYAVLADGTCHLHLCDACHDSDNAPLLTIPVIGRVPARLDGYTNHLHVQAIRFYIHATPGPNGYYVSVIDDVTDRPIAFRTWIVGGAILYAQQLQESPVAPAPATDPLQLRRSGIRWDESSTN